MHSTPLNLAKIVELRSEGFAEITHHAGLILNLATAIEELDSALISNSERNIDEQVALIAAAIRLSTLLECSGVSP